MGYDLNAALYVVLQFRDVGSKNNPETDSFWKRHRMYRLSV